MCCVKARAVYREKGKQELGPSSCLAGRVRAHHNESQSVCNIVASPSVALLQRITADCVIEHMGTHIDSTYLGYLQSFSSGLEFY